MGNHAQHIRESDGLGRPVTRRGRNWIEFDMGGGVSRFVTTIDPLHYSATLDQEIDTTWQPDTGAWQWKLVANDFHVHARNYLNAGDLVEWLDTRSGESVIVDPQSINWVDNLTDSRQQISTKQAVLGVPDDATMLWANGYGTGRHFRYTAHPKRLIKDVIIDSLASLPAPTVSNPYFEIEFIIKKSAGVTLYIDGQPWDNSTKTTTASRIEYRLANGTVAWYVPAPIAVDADGNTCPGILQVRRQGANRFCTVRFPKTWIDTAVFPIEFDDTFTDGYGGDATTYYDNFIQEDVADTNYGTNNQLTTRSYGGSRANNLLKFDLSTLSGVTINSATLYMYTSSADTMTSVQSFHRILAANSGWTEAESTWNYAVASTVRWEGDAADNGGTDAGCTQSGTDFAATEMGTYTYTASDVAGTPHIAALDLTEFGSMIAANYGITGHNATASARHRPGSSDHATTGYRPKLVVDYAEESASVSPSASPSVSPSPSPSGAAESASVSPSISPSASLSPSASESPSVSPSISLSISPSPSVSLSVSPSASVSPSVSHSPSISPSVSRSVSPSVSVSVSPSVSPSASPSVSPSISPSPSVSLSVSISASPSASPSVSLSASPSVSPSESPSLSLSASESPSVSPSVSPSGAPLTAGTVCWGHDTGVVEDNIRDISGNWTGTGEISGVGDAEQVCLESGEYMESEVVDTGINTVELLQNHYAAGDDVLLRYRHGATEAACLLAAWNNYTVPFVSLGFVQIRIESTL